MPTRPKNLFLAGSIALTLFLLFLPPTTQAAWSPKAPLAPCGARADYAQTTDYDESAECNLCHGFLLFQNLMDAFTLYIATPVAVVFLAWGAFDLIISKGEPAKRTIVRKRLQTVFLGLLIVWGAWLAINFIIQRVGNAKFFGPSVPAEKTEEQSEPNFRLPWNKINLNCVAPEKKQ